MAIKVETERLRIRNFKTKDASGLFAYFSSPRVNCFLMEQVGTLAEAADGVARKSREELHFAVCLKATDAIIGEVFAIKEEPDTYGVGWILNEQYEGKGYASEAARGFLDFLFTSRGARRIYGYVEEDNFRSQKLCERLGMRREALFMEFVTFTSNPDGTLKYENTFVYAMLKREWELRGKSNARFSGQPESW
ncbi:MAG: GNAT family N-acetyltransferase [Desulfovibrio sp.]|uniref:GNAT family N-acetyltransferase n=1 Tax=Desulfovibrio sp. 7SRBS1 TaxID=3378064 RepID=UPI003B3D8553